MRTFQFDHHSKAYYSYYNAHKLRYICNNNHQRQSILACSAALLCIWEWNIFVGK